MFLNSDKQILPSPSSSKARIIITQSWNPTPSPNPSACSTLPSSTAVMKPSPSRSNTEKASRSSSKRLDETAIHNEAKRPALEIARILDECWLSQAVHRRKLKDLKALRSPSHIELFLNFFTRALNPLFGFAKRTVSTERTVRFVSAFAALQVEKSGDAAVCNAFPEQPPRVALQWPERSSNGVLPRRAPPALLAAAVMAKNALVTGGAGYIDSHTVLQLLLAGFKAAVVDNLDNSSVVAMLELDAL